MAVLIEKYAEINRSFFIFEELLEYQWKNYFSMFRFLQKKIEEGVRQARISTVHAKGRTSSCFF